MPRVENLETFGVSLSTNYSFRSVSSNFQWFLTKSCSDWVSYFSIMSEVWSFFLIFYFFALFFFVYYILPEALSTKRLAINAATPRSWLSSTISCGVPFVLIFSILYESVYMLFTNEVFPSKISPLFLIEGKQWKWEYRFNLLGLLEASFFKKSVGDGTELIPYRVTSYDLEVVINKLNSFFGSDLFENSLRVKSEFLKSKKNGCSVNDFLFIKEGSFLDSVGYKASLGSPVDDFFLKFRVGEVSKRMLTTTKTLSLPDFPLVKAHITGCDVIHSWTIPGLGIRIDAVPGKIYSVKIPFKYYGIFVGQCSEVCGLRHAYMPISIMFLPYSFFIKVVYIYIFFSIDFITSKSKNNLFL